MAEVKLENALFVVFLLMHEFQPCLSSSNGICKCNSPMNVHWTQALEFCHTFSSSLPNFQTRSIMNIFNQTCLYGSNKYWTGRFKLESDWIDIVGCYSASDVIRTNSKTWEVNITHCFAYCHQYKYFGLKNSICICFNELPREALKNENACVSCNNAKYVCGKDGYIAVYTNGIAPRYRPKLTMQQFRCLTVSCTTSIWRSFTENCDTTNKYSYLCHDKPFKDFTSWEIAWQRCMVNNHHLAGTYKITEYCKNMNANIIRLGQFWTYLHKEVVYIDAVTSDIFRNYSQILCEFITLNPEVITFGSCEEIEGIVCIKNGEERENCPHGSTITTNKNLDFTKSENGNSISISKVTTHSVTKKRTTQPPSVVSDDSSSTENNQTIYIVVGCSIGALIISVVVTIICCKIRRKNIVSKYVKKTESKSPPTNKNSSNKFPNNHTSSNTCKHENSYVVPSYNFVKQPYDVIDIVDPKQEVVNENDETGIHCRTTKQKSYTEPWSDDIGRVFKHKMVDNETTLPKNNIPNNQYSLVRKRGVDNHENKEDHEIEFKKDDYDHINNVKVEYKKKHSIKDETCDKGPINRTTDEDDYDQFERNNVNKSGPASNYDHVAMHRKISSTKDNFEEEDDLEDYDHLQKSPKRPESVDSTYDRTHTVNYEDTYNHFNPKHPSANPDTYGHLPNEDDDDDYATADNQDDDNKISGDYEISDELPAVRVNSGNRESHYTSVTLPEMDA